jgi:hypothetical protein
VTSTDPKHGKDRKAGLLAPLAFGVALAAASAILIASLGVKVGVPLALLVAFLDGYALGVWDTYRIGLHDDLFIVWAGKAREMLRNARPGRADE